MSPQYVYLGGGIFNCPKMYHVKKFSIKYVNTFFFSEQILKYIRSLEEKVGELNKQASSEIKVRIFNRNSAIPYIHFVWLYLLTVRFLIVCHQPYCHVPEGNAKGL